MTRLEARVLNLFNSQTALSVDNRAFLDPRTRQFDGTQVAGDPASYTRALIINTTQPNAALGQPTQLRAAAATAADGTGRLLESLGARDERSPKKSRGRSRVDRADEGPASQEGTRRSRRARYGLRVPFVCVSSLAPLTPVVTSFPVASPLVFFAGTLW